MSQSYYNQFKIKDVNKVFLFGDRYKISLLRQLASESVKSGKQALVISNVPESYPVEGKVLVADETALLTNLVKDDQPEIIYLASKIKDDQLYPFSKKEITQLFRNVNDNYKLFILLDQNGHKDLFTSKRIKDSSLICSLNYNLLKENLPDLDKLKDLKRKSSSEQVSDKLYKLINSICSNFLEFESKSDKICYIGQVKGMFDENVILPVVRNLKTLLGCRMLIGDINSYHLKEV